MITDGHGTPLAIALTGGNRHDVTQLLPLVDAVPRIRGKRGRPRNRPRSALRRPRLRLRQVPQAAVETRDQTGDRPSQRPTRLRTRRRPMGVERTNAWIHGFRRLRTRWDIRDDMHEAFLKLACCVITYRRVLRTAGSKPVP
ncbi:transposase [Streptomyces sp. TLI_171]|uniref:transposase n=1 Tax=Streptomyces sp. TLI_171 TaxID=1938859 RepID=UPI0037DA331E